MLSKSDSGNHVIDFGGLKIKVGFIITTLVASFSGAVGGGAVTKSDLDDVRKEHAQALQAHSMTPHKDMHGYAVSAPASVVEDVRRLKRADEDSAREMKRLRDDLQRVLQLQQATVRMTAKGAPPYLRKALEEEAAEAGVEM